MRITTDDGINLKLRLMGGQGPGLLICHATGFHGAAYGPLATRLKGHFTVWALDFRGHGASGGSPSGRYHWNDMAADAAACAQAVDAPKLFGFGHSMGGAALLIAEKTRPGSFAGLFLYEPIVLPEGSYQRDGNPSHLAEGARRRREVFDSRSEALTRYAQRPPLNALRAEALAAYVEDGFVDLPDGRVRLACRPETEASVFEASGTMTSDDLFDVYAATTIAAGSVPSHPDPASFAPAVAAALPRGRLLHCHGLGHFGPLESPGVIAAHVIDALLGS